jgi:hypothetical protein
MIAVQKLEFHDRLKKPSEFPFLGVCLVVMFMLVLAQNSIRLEKKATIAASKWAKDRGIEVINLRCESTVDIQSGLIECRLNYNTIIHCNQSSECD